MAELTDSPLSITASIAGILTFLVAILAALYVRLTYLRNADIEYFQVKNSLKWYKTESSFMGDLVSRTDLSLNGGGVVSMSVLSSRSGTGLEDENDRFGGDGDENGTGNLNESRKGDFQIRDNPIVSPPAYQEKAKQKEMYISVLDELGRLEARLLELLAEVEEGIDMSGWETGRHDPDRKQKGESGEGWTLVPRGWRGRTDIAVRWMGVRGQALELVRQRDALGSRVLFAQMSLVSSRVRDQEAATARREHLLQTKMSNLESMVITHNEKLDRLEGLVFRVMHRERVTRVNGSVDGLKDERGGAEKGVRVESGLGLGGGELKGNLGEDGDRHGEEGMARKVVHRSSYVLPLSKENSVPP